MDLDEFISTPESAAAADACANETMSAAIPCHQASAQEYDGNSSDGGSTDSEEWLLQLKEAERRLELEEAKRWSQSQPVKLQEEKKDGDCSRSLSATIPIPHEGTSLLTTMPSLHDDEQYDTNGVGEGSTATRLKPQYNMNVSDKTKSGLAKIGKSSTKIKDTWRPTEAFKNWKPPLGSVKHKLPPKMTCRTKFQLGPVAVFVRPHFRKPPQRRNP